MLSHHVRNKMKYEIAKWALPPVEVSAHFSILKETWIMRHLLSFDVLAFSILYSLPDRTPGWYCIESLKYSESRKESSLALFLVNNSLNLNKIYSLERLCLLIIPGFHLILHNLSLWGTIFQSKNGKIYRLYDLSD